MWLRELVRAPSTVCCEAKEARIAKPDKASPTWVIYKEARIAKQDELGDKQGGRGCGAKERKEGSTLRSTFEADKCNLKKGGG